MSVGIGADDDIPVEHALEVAGKAVEDAIVVDLEVENAVPVVLDGRVSDGMNKCEEGLWLGNLEAVLEVDDVRRFEMGLRVLFGISRCPDLLVKLG